MLNPMLNGLKQLLFGIGYFAEYIAFIIVLFLIYYKFNYFILFIILFLGNRLLNNKIKDILKGERPKNPIKYLDIDKFGKKKYGMPSGHSQLTFFSIVYAFLVLHKINGPLLFLLFVGIISIIQRYIFRNHTLNQLLFGALLGSIIAYISILIINKF
jgi:membrane-associated phospholipid phosphatase